MSIRRALHRDVFLLIVFPFLLFSLLITNIYANRLEQAMTESLYVVADAQIVEMANFCEQQREYLNLLGYMDVSRAALKGNLEGDGVRYLDNIVDFYVKMLSYMNSITIIDKKNRVVASSDTEHKAFADEGIGVIIKRMNARSFYISDVLVDANGKKTLVAIAKIEDNGELLGYVLGEISLDFYVGMRERVELWNEATFYLLDGSQKIISAGTSNEERDSFVTTNEERTEFNNQYTAIDFEKNPNGSFQYKFGGTHYITYYSNAEFTDWRIMLTVNLDNYQAERMIYFMLACFLLSLCIVLAFWIGRFASRHIIRPINRISDTMKRIEENQDYSLRIGVERNDELGKLCREINELVGFIETEDLYKTQQQRLLKEKADQDALTKALNKERINEYLKEAIERQRLKGSKMAVMFVDVDNFKAFNTDYGHKTGDQVLLFLTSILSRETNGTVGRVGGDEFLVVVETLENIEDLDLSLNKVKQLAESKFVLRGSGVQLPITCCIGVVQIDFSITDSQNLTSEHLIHLADIVMYQVKKNGKHGHAILNYEEFDSITLD